jgi:hypothetical protein
VFTSYSHHLAWGGRGPLTQVKPLLAGGSGAGLGACCAVPHIQAGALYVEEHDAPQVVKGPALEVVAGHNGLPAGGLCVPASNEHRRRSCKAKGCGVVLWWQGGVWGRVSWGRLASPGAYVQAPCCNHGSFWHTIEAETATCWRLDLAACAERTSSCFLLPGMQPGPLHAT